MNKIKYLSVEETAKRWQISERSVRNYCLQGRIVGTLLEGKTWNIPSDAEKPHRKIRHTAKQDTLLSFLKREKETGLKGGIYHKIQIDLTYNSNHIEGSKLTHDQTRFIFETKTLGVTDEVVKVDDIIETVNHFHCIDLIIEGAHTKLSESFAGQCGAGNNGRLLGRLDDRRRNENLLQGRRRHEERREVEPLVSRGYVG